MKVLLPEHIGDITLNQFQRYSDLLERENISDDKREKLQIEIFTGMSFRSIVDMQHKDKVDILKQIDAALEVTPEFKNTFVLNGIEFGFITNFDKIMGNEFTDINRYQNDVKLLHRLMAILFRPVTDKDKFDNYKIEEYNGTEQYAELMKQMPLLYVNGALSFFLNLSNELGDYIQAFTQEVQARAVMH